MPGVESGMMTCFDTSVHRARRHAGVGFDFASPCAYALCMGAPRIDEPFIRQMLEHLPNTAVFMFGPDLVYTLVGGGLLREPGLEPKAIEGAAVLVEMDITGRSRAHDACVAALQGSTTSFELKTTQDRFLE